MTAIDKAALIEQAATLSASVYIEAMPKPKAFTKADHKTIAGLIADDLTAALPIIAAGLLEPLRRLHKPVHLVVAWNSGIRSEDPCETCGGKAGIYECGCWADYDRGVYCEACSATSEFKHATAYPCPTLTLIDAILAEVTE